jgi:hypothetical protein
MTDTSYSYPSAPAVPPAATQPAGHRRKSAVFWGVMLIVLGAAFLAAQFVPSVSWWMLWPLAVISAGIAHMVLPGGDDVWAASRFFEGMGTVLVGAVLLGNTTGFVSWTVWVTFLSLWPLLLIALGISVIGRGVGLQWLRTASRILVWATLVLAVYVSLTGAALGWANPDGAVVRIPGAGANGRTLTITIEPGSVPSIRTF